VGINSDASVKKYKPHKIVDRPIVPEQERMFLVAALEAVDYVFMFDEPTNVSNIIELRPSYFAKGKYTASSFNREETKAAKTTKTEIHLLEGTETSTTNIVKKILSG